jgi:iron complex outermembrane receptor protein
VSPNIGASSSSNFDWKAGVNWRPADDSLYFFSVATGYKAGGFNDGIGSPYDPEEVLSYEIGTKQMFQGRRLMLNGSIFYMDYSDLQVSATGIGPTGLPGLFTQNAAEATVEGGEVELVALVGESARIDASVGYVDATYDEYVTDDPSVGGTLLEDLEGNKLTKAPEWTFNVGAEYEFQLGGIGTLTPRVQFHYEDDQFLREFNKPVDHEDSFTRTDIIVSYRHSNGQWYLEAFVNNIEDEDVRNNLQNFPGHGLQYQLDAPRTYGVRIGFEL